MDLLRIAAAVFLGLCSHSAAAQETLKTQSDCSAAKPFESALAIDQRTHNVIGVIQKGAFNRAVRLQFDGTLASRMAFFFADDTTTTAQPQAVLVLRDFFLTERTGGMSETGFFKLNLSIFARYNNRYYEALQVDTTYQVSGMDVTQKLMRFVSQQLCMLASAMVRLPAAQQALASSYSLDEIPVIDSLEKRQLPAYADSALKPGIYKSYDDFRNNRPQEAVLHVENLGRNDYAVYDLRKKKKGVRIQPGQIYAVVQDSLLLKCTVRGFYPMWKNAGNYYFSGLSATYEVPSGSVGGMLMAGALGGAIGSAIYGANAWQNSPVEQKSRFGYDLYQVNHRTGRVFLVE